jgi:hypothetical protein
MRGSGIVVAAGLVLAMCGGALAQYDGPPPTKPPPVDKMYPRPDGPWRKYTGNLPPCDDGRVLRRITWQFDETESLYWDPVLTLKAFTIPKEVAFMPWGLEFVPRRYCRSDVLVSDGKMRPLWYSIGEGLGEAGFGWGVEWCVTGLDRLRAYAPRCKMAQP